MTEGVDGEEVREGAPEPGREQGGEGGAVRQVKSACTTWTHTAGHGIGTSFWHQEFWANFVTG